MAQQELQLINALKEIFPEESWSWAIPALRRTPLIWNLLQSPGTLEYLVQEVGSEPSDWTPARIGAAVLKMEDPDLISWPIQSFNGLSTDLQNQVNQIYQDSVNQSEQNLNLTDVFLLSLALIGELETGKTWSEILGELSPLKKWVNPMIFCFDLIKDKADFIHNLEPDYGLEILSAIPVDPSGRIDILERVLLLMDAERMELWLREISKEVPDLVTILAQSVLDKTKFDKSNIQETLTLSLLNQLAGNDETALRLLEEASDQNQKIHGKLAANLNKVRTNLDQPQLNDKSWKELKQSLGDSEKTSENVQEISEVIRSLLDNKLFAAAGDLLSNIQDPLPDHPELLTALAEYALSQDQINRSSQLAVMALEKSQKMDHSPLSLSTVLFQLDMMEECLPQ